MSYTVLARRYRSETFDDVVGQDHVSKTLKNAITGDRVAHAYLFTGTRGVGKTTMARILAKALNCLAAEKPTVEPCCKCESCQAVAEGADLDVIEIDAASNTGVDHIRELRQNAIYRPSRARFKVYIIDEVHMLSTSAFNALLKTLEEPPEHVKFILATTEPNKILPTILSRCQRFDFHNIRTEDIATQLELVLKGEKVKADKGLVRRIARLARGSMRDALSLLDQVLSVGADELTAEALSDLLGTPRSEYIVSLVQAIGQGELAEALGYVDKALGQGLALEQFADSLQCHFRDLLVLRNCGAETELVELDDGPTREAILEQTKLFDDATLIYNITVAEELRRATKSSGSTRPLLEAAIVRLATAERFSDTKAILQQLQALQQGNPGIAGAATSRPAGAIAMNRANSAGPTKQQTTAASANSGGRFGAGGTNAQAAGSPNKRSSGASATLEIPEAITLEYLRNNWSDILGALDGPTTRHLQMYVKPWQPMEWADGTMTLGCVNGQEGASRLLVDRPDTVAELAEALSKVLYTPVKLRLNQTGGQSRLQGSNNSNNGDNGQAVRVPGAKPSQKEIDAALADRHVKDAQRMLGGTVRRVHRTASQTDTDESNPEQQA